MILVRKCPSKGRIDEIIHTEPVSLKRVRLGSVSAICLLDYDTYMIPRNHTAMKTLINRSRDSA